MMRTGMKPTLTYKPNDYAYQDLLMKFADGKPLSCDQLHFLAWHERTLSNPRFDPVLKYYLKHYHRPYTQEHSFLSPSDKMDKESIARLKRKLNIFLNNTSSHLELKMKPEDFAQFRSLTYDELIYFHGNQFLTGAPFYPGGIPQIIYFQWGNLFGVAKYVVLAEERALKSNVLIYFEDRYERHLQECVYAYHHHMKDEIKQQLRLAPTPHHQQHYDEQPLPNYQSTFRIPTLSPYPPTKLHEED
jgi:hypothetical protein